MHQISKRGSLRERLYFKSLEYSKRYADTPHCDANIRATFSTLRDLVKFFDEYHDQKYQLALETLTKLQLVPLHVSDLELCVNNFKRFVFELYYFAMGVISLPNIDEIDSNFDCCRISGLAVR